jgi:predicted amidohydrolase
VSRQVRVSATSADFLVLDPARPDRELVTEVLDYWSGRIGQMLPDRPDLIVLPEVCDRPDNFSLDRRLQFYEARGSRVLDAMREAARENRCYVVYPTERRDQNGALRNSAHLIDRRGEVAGIYDKMFITLSQMEEGGFQCGTEAPQFTCDFGTLGMAICYDLNFPDLLNAYARLRPDIIVFPSHFHGSVIATYWALKSGAYMVGAIARNECYVVSPAGNTLGRSGPGMRFLTATLNLDRCVVHCPWSELHRLEELKRLYGATAVVTEAGFMGCFLVASVAEGTSARAMAKKVGLEPLEGPAWPVS